MYPFLARRALCAYLAAFFAGFLPAIALPAAASEVQVMISGGYATTLADLAPVFEKETGNKVVMVRGPSMGETPEAIPNRLKRGEPADVLILVDSVLDRMIHEGKALADTRAALARSGIAIAVRAGAPHPDVTSMESFRKALLAAKSIAVSDSASGVYATTVLFVRMGIWESIHDKCRVIPGEPAGAVLARGEAELGLQQMSELKPIGGIDILGPLPQGAQKYTTFAGAVTSAAKNPDAARALLHFLATSPLAATTAVKNGMEAPRN